MLLLCGVLLQPKQPVMLIRRPNELIAAIQESQRKLVRGKIAAGTPVFATCHGVTVASPYLRQLLLPKKPQPRFRNQTATSAPRQLGKIAATREYPRAFVTSEIVVGTTQFTAYRGAFWAKV